MNSQEAPLEEAVATESERARDIDDRNTKKWFCRTSVLVVSCLFLTCIVIVAIALPIFLPGDGVGQIQAPLSAPNSSPPVGRPTTAMPRPTYEETPAPTPEPT